NAQAFTNFSVAKRVAFIDSGLISCCPNFPLLAEFAFPAFQMTDDFLCLASTHGATDVARHFAGTHQPSEVFTFKIELHKPDFAFTVEAFFADGLNYADTMTGM